LCSEREGENNAAEVALKDGDKMNVIKSQRRENMLGFF
jgi:hypothetical protein